MMAHTVDEVIEQLTDIIDRSRREKSRLGYFAALYRKVTVQVKKGIASGRFENGPRMERLDVTFSDLRAIYEYLSAIPHAEPGRCGFAGVELGPSQ